MLTSLFGFAIHVSYFRACTEKIPMVSEQSIEMVTQGRSIERPYPERVPTPKANAATLRQPNNIYSQMSPQRGTLAVMVRTFKAAVTTQCRQAQMAYTIWQRNYYEHIIRNERELGILREYIQNNPKRWEIDQLHPNNPSKW